MAVCPLCSERSAKRYCPAKEDRICAVCCGSKREIEIDCPLNCPHLKAAYSYESEKQAPDPELLAKVRHFDQDFIYRFSFALSSMNEAVIDEWKRNPWLADIDVVEVFKALAATMRTLSNGIYYESTPEGGARQALFANLRSALDRLMSQASPGHTLLKASEAADVIDFLTFVAQVNSGSRPRSRRYLDWLLSTLLASLPDAPTVENRIIC